MKNQRGIKHEKMKYKIVSDFLDADAFGEIRDLVTDQDFPWRRRDHMAGDSDKMYFTYNFYNGMEVSSGLYKLHILPVLQKLEAVAPVEVRANMSISELYEVSGWHCDYKLKCKSAILYLNGCDGGTELKIDEGVTTVFIKSEANKMLIFDADVLHRGITSKREPVRYIINFNYFTQ